MHPQVIGRGYRMMMLERLINHYKSFSDVKFTTLIDYVEDWRAKNPLVKWRDSGAIHAQPKAQRQLA
jgi:hypothetical protein